MTRAVQIAELGDQNVFTIDGDNNRVGIGSTQPTVKLDVDGVVVATAFTGDGSGLTGIAVTNNIITGTAATFTSGINVSGASNIDVTGVVTATTFSGNITGVAATFTGDVTIGGELTYEDVTNVDSVGFATFRKGINVQGAGSTTTTLNVTGVSTFGGNVSIADSIFHTGDTDTAIRFPAADVFSVETGGTERGRFESGVFLVGLQGENRNFGDEIAAFKGNRTGAGNPGTISLIKDGSSPTGDIGLIHFGASDDHDGYYASIRASSDGSTGGADLPGRLTFETTADSAASPTERLRITSRGGFQFSNGFMSETVKINTTARTGTQAVNLDDGMVHYFSTNSSGTWKPNFTMSAGNDINATIAIGDVFSPTMIVAKGATTHFANAIQVDGSDVTPEFSGGAPTDGGGSGTFDVYNYTIIKTGDDTFKAFAAVSIYE